MKNRIDIHPLTGEVILVTPNRLSRPNARIDQTRNDACPFCPGHESETPPELERVPSADGWLIRVVPNKFPITAGGIDGVHEVIIESPQHRDELRHLDRSHVEALIDVWLRRVAVARTKPGVRAVILFRNRGVNAGESIQHPHSQLVGLPFVPSRISAQRNEAESCPVCRIDGSLVIAEGEEFRLVAAPSPRYPYQLWIVPRTHSLRPVGGGASISELGALLQKSERLLHEELGDVSVNWHFCEAPVGVDDFHWYIEISPRITGIAGLEIATGAFVNLVPSEECARKLQR